MDPVRSGTGVFYQAMPAVGADGKNIMKLIPVQMVNGQFVRTQITKPRIASPQQKAVTINISSVSGHMVKKAALNPSATEECVRNQVSFVNVLPKQVGLNHGNSLNTQRPQQQTVNAMAKVPLIGRPAKNVGKLVRLPYQLPVTVKSPAFPSGQYLQVPSNAQGQTVPASKLSELIKKQIFTSSANSAPGPGLPSVVYVSPVMPVNQGVIPPCDSVLSSLNLVSKTSNKTSSGPPAKGSKPLLKLVPKVSQRPNSPIKWVIEEEDSSTASNLNLPDLTSVTSAILRTVAERENMTTCCDNIRKNSQLSQGKSGQGQNNALVICSGKVFYVAKKCSLSLKTGKSNLPTSATECYKINKTTVPSTQQCLESDAQTQQDLRIIIPDESNEVIDLCDDDDDDSQEDSFQPAASVNVSAIAHQDEDNVIFVSYIPPKSDAGLPHKLILKTQRALEKEIEQTGTSSLDKMTGNKSLEGGSGNDSRDEGSAVRGRQTDQRGSVSTVENVLHVCPSAVMNMHYSEGSNALSCQSTSTQEVGRMEDDVETKGPADPSTFDRSGGACPRKQDSHKKESISNPAPGWTSLLVPKPCQMTNHQLRQVFGITAEVKICLQRIDEALARSVPADPLKSNFSSELFLQKLSSSAISCSLINVKSALFSLKTKRLSALKSKCHSDQSSLKGVSYDVKNVPVIGYVEPIDEDFPSTATNELPSSEVTAAQPQTQTCVDVNIKTRRMGRTRKRTMCPCCMPCSLEPLSKIQYKVR